MQQPQPVSLHFCTDLPLQYRYRKIKSVISALGTPVAEHPRETYVQLKDLASIPTLPLLQTPEGAITSANTIIRYLSAANGYRLYGGDNLYIRALVDQWLDMTVCDFDTCVMALNLYLEGKEVDIETVVADAEKYLAHLNKTLKNRKYIVGEELTIADLAIAATVAPVLTNLYGEEERKKYGPLVAWYHGIAALSKDIEPKELPKKMHKKFDKKKEGKDGKDTKDNKDGKEGKEGKKEKGAKQGKQEEAKGNKKDKKKDKDTSKKEEKKQQKKDDLFGSDSDAEATKPAPKVQAKKPEKKKPQAKSIVVFNVKVFEQEQDLTALANDIRSKIQQEGLVWNQNIEIRPVAFGMNMLEMGCVIEDAKVSVQEDIFNKILDQWEKEVQSVDTCSFQKL